MVIRMTGEAPVMTDRGEHEMSERGGPVSAATPVQAEIYTDGACRGNPGPGGWGAVMRIGDTVREISGGEARTTNNRMELMATIEALQALPEGCVVDLYTDSQYVKCGIDEWIHSWVKNNWRTSQKKPVKNADLWQTLLEAAGRHKVTWHWVRAHVGNISNERADMLARLAAVQYVGDAP